MAGRHFNFWLVCSVLALLNSCLGWALVDPDLLAFGGSSNVDKNSPTSLEQCQNELTTCRRHTSEHAAPTQDQVLDQMKQVVGSWMYRVGMHNFELPPGDKKSVSLTLTLSDMDLRSVNTFLKDHTYNNFMSMVPILNRIFTVDTRNPYSEFNAQKSESIMERKEKWIRILFNVIMSFMNKETMLVVTSLILAYVIVKAMIFGANPMMLLTLFIMSVFFAGFLWNWAYMYQKAVVDQHVKRVKYEKYASSCQPDDSFWGFMKTLFGYHATIDECTEYYRGLQIDPLIMVPPTVALSETLAMFVVHPCVLIAESMHKITRILFGNMVWGMYYGTLLVMLIFGIMFTLFFILITGRRVNLKFLSIFSVEVGPQFENYYRYRPLPGVDREMIENQRRDDIDYQRTTSETEQGKESAVGNAPSPSGNVTDNGNTNTNNQQGNSASNCGPSTNMMSTCCTAAAQPVCRSHPVVSQCARYYSQPCEGFNSTCHPSPRISPGSVSRENSDNLLRRRISPCTSGDTSRNKQQPFRDVTFRNVNIGEVTRGWADENGGEMEEFYYARRRKLSI